MHQRARGFSLLEMVVAITIFGLLAMVAVPLLRAPVASHIDTARRGALATELDTVVNRMRTDLAQALPNSVRVTGPVGGRYYLEYLEVRAVGRYRDAAENPQTSPLSCPASCAAAGDNDVFTFGTCSESCFTSLGPLTPATAVPVAGSDWVVMHPLGPGVPNGDPYFGGTGTPAGAIKSRLQGVAAAPGGSQFTLAAHTFPMPSGTVRRHFYLVSQPVTYECNPATRRLTRIWGYAVTQAQPVAFGGGVNRAPLATRVQACTIAYRAMPMGSATANGGVVSVRLRLAPAPMAGAIGTEAAETVAEFSVREP